MNVLSLLRRKKGRTGTSKSLSPFQKNMPESHQEKQNPPKNILPDVLKELQKDGFLFTPWNENESRSHIFTYQGERYLLTIREDSNLLTLTKVQELHTWLDEDAVYRICVEASERAVCSKICVLSVKQEQDGLQEYILTVTCQFFTTPDTVRTFFINYLGTMQETIGIFNAYYERMKKNLAQAAETAAAMQENPLLQ